MSPSPLNEEDLLLRVLVNDRLNNAYESRMKRTDDIKNNQYSPGSSQEIAKCGVKFVMLIFVCSLFSVLIWDMHRVQELSEIIHDDHSNMWIDMNTSALRDWYTPLDICLLKIIDDNTDIETYKKENCSHVPLRNVHNYQHVCGIGSSLGKPCYPPIASRSYFMKRLLDENLGNPFSGTLNRALRRISTENKTVVFIGDGISKQNQLALFCEMMRTQMITISGDIFSNNFTIHWSDSKVSIGNPGGGSLDVHFFYMKTLKSLAERNRLRSHRSRIEGNETIPLSANISESGIFSENILEANISDFGALQSRVHDIELGYRGLVVIANIGAWYNTRDRYREELKPFISWLSDLGKHHLVFFRETSSQHWNLTSNGYFEKGANPAEGSCAPIQDLSKDLDWRNYDVYKMIENIGLQEYINVIPFRDVTAPLYDMHPTNRVTKDCTHFCYFPQIWQTVWNEIDAVTYNASKPHRRG